MADNSRLVRGDQINILLVDDDETIRDYVSSILTLDGYNVLVADSGERAMQLLEDRKTPLQLLLSNVQMPGITGVELGTKVSHERPEIKVMLMSGFEGGMLVLDQGWHFLHKPFVPSQLLGIIKAVLAQAPVPDLNERERD